ncbi:MAG: hypothetical protein HC905_28535 [Bacteroidales bacterium]|nr:hypothetical protein [Bacteroidales bacterium]
MVKPLVIRAKDISVIMDCSPATSSRRLSLIKDALNKKPHQQITLNEFCKYYDLPVNEVIDKINQHVNHN